MFTPGPDNHTQTFTGQNTTSITESGTHSGGSGVKFPKVRNELIAIPPTTDISSHFQTSRTSNHLEDPQKLSRLIPRSQSLALPRWLRARTSQLLPEAWD